MAVGKLRNYFMCGIAGKFFFDSGEKVEHSLIKKMCSTIVHRGPDDEGIFVDENFGFGMRRLSIIDLQGGHQPIFNEDKSLAIVFNGEIYNYKELKKDLEGRGHQFSTNSDTETILHCYEEFGIDFLHKLNGMFAIAIWDTRNKKLILARDRLGIKPLYYFRDNEKVVFGSEIKAILEDRTIEREVNFEALDLYLSFMYVPAPYSMFKNIHKLSSAHYLLYENNRVSIKRYWDVNFVQESHKSEDEFIEEFNELFEDSVRKRMISDVPLGAFLSGGVDSSSIVAEMSKLTNEPVRTFSIGFEEGSYDETEYAELVAKKYKTNHTTFKVNSDMFDLLPEYIYHFDEPFADYAAFPTYVISKLAREHVTVVLTGDGGDEIFAGYKRYMFEKLAEYYQKIPACIRNHLLLNCFRLGEKMLPPDMRVHDYFTGAIRRTKLANLGSDGRYIANFYKFGYDAKNKLFADAKLVPDNFSLNDFSRYWEGKGHYDNLSKRLYLDIMTSLPEDMLTKVDRVTMAVSLEARVPFLDHRIVEFAGRLPSKYKMNLFNLKRFVKKSAQDRLPEEIIKRPKHGFGSPIDKWFRGDLRKLVCDTLSETAIKKQGIFNYSFIDNMIKSHIHNKSNKGEELFMLLVFQMWYDRFLK